MKHLDIVLQKRNLSGLYASLAVKLQAFLMANIDQKTAEHLHNKNKRTYSLFTMPQKQNIIFRISLIGDEALPLYTAAKNTRTFYVSGLDGGIDVLNTIESENIDLDTLKSKQLSHFKMLLASPATYIHNGSRENMFSLPSYFFSVADKLKSFHDNDIPHESIRTLFQNVSYQNYRIQSEKYPIKRGQIIPGACGELELKFTGKPNENEALSLLFRYAEYSGIGAKTALGMGGILIDEIGL